MDDIGSQLTEILEQYWESKAFDEMAAWCKSICLAEIRNQIGEFADERDSKLVDLEHGLDLKVTEVKKSLMDWVLGSSVVRIIT
jgi:hypothetical protein